MTEPINNIDTELGEILDLFEKRLDTVRHVPCKHEIKNIKCDKLGCVSLDEWRKGTKANHGIVVKTAKAQIQALLNKSVLEARIDENEHNLNFGEKYWQANAYKHFKHRLTQLRQITEQENK